MPCSAQSNDKTMSLLNTIFTVGSTNTLNIPCVGHVGDMTRAFNISGCMVYSGGVAQI